MSEHPEIEEDALAYAIAAFCLSQVAVWTAIDSDSERRARALSHIDAAIVHHRRRNPKAADRLEMIRRAVAAGGPKPN